MLARIAAAAAAVAVPLVGLALLGACAPPEYLLSERTDGAPRATTSSLRGVPARYTDHTPGTAPTQVVTLWFTGPFTEDEHGRILAAVGEWNRVLNGAARFDVTPAPLPDSWSIIASKQGVSLQEWRTPQPLVAHLRFAQGGMIVVYVSRLAEVRNLDVDAGGRDLRGLMVHELGSALGGGNGPTLVTSRFQDCIDENMAESVGSILKIPKAQLNWCETGGAVAAR
jgi:hypothetical protein